MTENVLVALDGSPLAERALECALDTHSDATITALYVIDPVEGMYDAEPGGGPVADQWYDDIQEVADEVHEDAREAAAERGVELRTATEPGQPAREIVRYAEENDMDRIFLGSHGRKGLERLLVGSVAEEVIRNTKIPVTVVG